MRKIKIINIDNNAIITTFRTAKRSYNTIQNDVINEIKKIYNNRLWLQGKINFVNRYNNNCLIGGSLWWIVAGCDGRLQFSIEEE